MRADWIDPWSDPRPGEVSATVAQELKRERVMRAHAGRKQTWRGLGELQKRKHADATHARAQARAHDWNEGVEQ